MSDFSSFLLIFTEQCFWPVLSEFYCIIGAKGEIQKWRFNSLVKTLVALEDLGRGSTGKAWLCVTVTKPCSAVCVLKFDNKHDHSNNLMEERKMWNLLYPELSHMIKLERWSGSDTLVMPHLSTVLEHERREYRESIFEVLTTKFQKNRKVHNDVRWCNIGKYRSKCGKVIVVIYDLHDVVDYDAGAHNDWIEKSIQSLSSDVLWVKRKLSTF